MSSLFESETLQLWLQLSKGFKSQGLPSAWHPTPHHLTSKVLFGVQGGIPHGGKLQGSQALPSWAMLFSIFPINTPISLHILPAGSRPIFQCTAGAEYHHPHASNFR